MVQSPWFTDTYAPDGIIMENPFNSYWLDTTAKCIDAYNWFDYWCHDCGLTVVFLQKDPSDPTYGAEGDNDPVFVYSASAQFCAALAMQLNGPFVGVGCRTDWNDIGSIDGSDDYWWNWPADAGTQTYRSTPDEDGNCYSTYSKGWTLYINISPDYSYHWEHD